MTQAMLFSDGREAVAIGQGIVLLAGYADASQIWQDAQALLAQAPLRNLVTPGGQRMSVAMSNCGALGWVSDKSGYRYTDRDPLSGEPWPAMPQQWFDLANEAARRAGFDGFKPDACLINCYEPGARMGLHQDRDESDFTQPIVSVSLGLSAKFLIGGHKRSDPVRSITLSDGDALVFGGAARLMFHGVRPLADGDHLVLGARRINLTFRKAGI
jgi:DNA oxidative demethylase